MFSSGTFHRYLMEIESTQKRMRELYQQLLEQTSDESVHKTVAAFMTQLEDEQEMIRNIRQMLPA